MLTDKDSITFESTGNLHNANRGIIGLSCTEDAWVVYEGYDGELCFLSQEEKLELANYMINLWNKYKRDVEKKHS